LLLASGELSNAFVINRCLTAATWADEDTRLPAAAIEIAEDLADFLVAQVRERVGAGLNYL
jgi:hypothetical protein